jgi:hypothetical protein
MIRIKPLIFFTFPPIPQRSGLRVTNQHLPMQSDLNVF